MRLLIFITLLVGFAGCAKRQAVALRMPDGAAVEVDLDQVRTGSKLQNEKATALIEQLRKDHPPVADHDPQAGDRVGK